MSRLDPITFAVLHASVRSIVNEMNGALFRSAYSPVITEGRDIGGAVFDAQGRLIGQGDWDLAVFVGMLEYSMRAILRDHGGSIEPGDVFIMNDPFVGGTHFNDVGIVRPIFDGGTLLAWVAVCGHWPDVGGQEPGSFVPNAREHFQEGLRIPPVKVYQAGTPNRAVFELIRANMRVPDERLGDLRAQVGATAIGESRLLELAGRHGADVLQEAFESSIGYSEKLLRQHVAAMPDGTYEGEDWVDMESLDRPIPKRVHVRLTIAGDALRFDFSASDAQSKSASNSTYSATASAVFVTTLSLFPDVPINHGCFQPIEIVAPEGTLVNARPPAAISGMAATVYEKVIGSCLAAFAHAVPEQAVGVPYNLINLTIGGRYRDHDYVAYLYSEGGFGARATKDGPPGLVSLYGGGAKITPVEVVERRYPIEFEEWALWADSGGPGRYRGGVGSRKTFRLTEGEARLTCLGDREKFPPFGILGGGPGAAQGLYLDLGGPREQNLTMKAVGVPFRAGDRITMLAAGGGGYGDPLERDPSLVAADVLDGFVSPEHAREAYGVITNPSGDVDAAATEEQRAGLRAGRGR